MALHYENILNFVTFYNKKRPKIESILVCKIHIFKLNGLKFSENVYIDKVRPKLATFTSFRSVKYTQLV